MLAHSPPLPLVIQYTENSSAITIEDEEGLISALKQRNRVRRFCLHTSVNTLKKFIVAIEKEYPILEYLIIWCWTEDDSTLLMFPETFHAPNLHHLALFDLLPIGSLLLTSAARLVTLCLVISGTSTYFHPNTLLQWLSFMPQLETLNINILFSLDSDEERQLTHPPVMTPVTLPNLHSFSFQGYTSMYVDVLVHRITPCPEKLEIYFPNQITLSIPRLVQFMKTTWNHQFESVKFKFSRWQVDVVVYPRGEAEMYSLSVTVESYDFDWLVSYVAQVSDSFGQIFSAVERLTLELISDADNWISEDPYIEQNGFSRIEWRQLLGSFSNVKTLRIENGFVRVVSRCLESDDGGLPSELLPELKELTYSPSDQSGDEFTSFIDARQDAGRPITLTPY